MTNHNYGILINSQWNYSVFTKKIAEQIYMLEFRDEYGFIIGIVFIVSISILTVNLIYTISKLISDIKAKRDFYATTEKRLIVLNNYQKAIVYGLYLQDNRTLPLPLYDGAVLELEQKKIIGKVSSGQYVIKDFRNPKIPYLLQPWVSEELSKNTKLLHGFESSFKRQYKKEVY